MTCPFCCHEAEGVFSYCPNCGQKQAEALPLLQRPRMLLICILLSLSALLRLCQGNLPIFLILYGVFLWIACVNARRGEAVQPALRGLSGTLQASYILSWVGCVLALLFALLLGGLFAVAGAVAGAMAGLESLLSALRGFTIRLLPFPAGLLVSASLLLSSFLILLASVGLTVCNLFGKRAVFRYVRSLHRSPERPERQRRAGIWLLVFGILAAVSALLNLQSFWALAAGLCRAAALLLAASLLREEQ